MRVKLLTGMAGEHFSHNPGDLLDLPADQALVWIGRGIAEPAPADDKADIASLRRELDALRTDVERLTALITAKPDPQLDLAPAPTAGRRTAR